MSEDLEPDELEVDVDEGDDALEDEPEAAPAIAERRCSTKRCLKKFTPTHPAQKLCAACRGHRVDASAAPKTDSWWTNTTSRDEFRTRAEAQEDRMKMSKEKFSVPNRILGGAS